MHFGDETRAAPGGGQFDLTELVQTEIVGDDVHVYEERRFLEATREARAEMAERACAARLRDALRELPGRLERIYTDPSKSTIARRRTLFIAWDECDDGEGGEGAQYAEMARATIVAFIAARLPRGSVDAYSDEEIALLNESRRSKARFEPYGPPDTRGPG